MADGGIDRSDSARIALPDEGTAEPPRRAARYRKPLLIAAPVVALIVILFFYLTGGRYESTDDAYVQSTKVQVSANVSGRVIAVEISPNQHVRQGQILFRIDPAPYQAKVDEAEAKLAGARQQVGALHANYGQGASELKAAQDRLHFAQRERDRQQKLLAEGISSQSQYDDAALAATAAAQQIETVRQQNAGVLASLGGAPDRPIAANPIVREAQATLDQAKLDLGYTVIRAPRDGIVTKVDQLPVGTYVEASKPLFTLVGLSLWVEANFKESQLHHMRVGQPARIKVDAFPDLGLTGRLASFSPGTGNSFALLPPENATGNWVKVTQRLPVEFSIDNVPAGIPLHAGLSVTVKVDTGHRRWPFSDDGTTGSPAAR